MIKTFNLDSSDKEINDFIGTVTNTKIVGINPVIIEYDLPKKKKY